MFQSSGRKRTIKNFEFVVQNKGEVKNILIHLPEGAKVKRIVVFAQHPSSVVVANTLLDEIGLNILQEDGNSILL